jgi:hypothetical protein
MCNTSSLSLPAALGLLLLIATTAPEPIDVIPRQWLMERLTIAEVEDPYADPRRRVQAADKEWQRLKERMQPGDELWTYEKRPWPGYGGIALVRNRVVVDEIWIWIH